MSDTVATPRPPETHSPTRAEPAKPRRSRPLALAAGHPWWIVGIALTIFSGLVVLWAHTRPGYDPYGWLVWGYQTLHLSLDLGGAPSWKPLPWLFTVPMSLAGHYSLWLWMLFSVTVSLSGCIFAGRIAYRLIARDGHGRTPAIIAAIFAGLAPLGIDQYMHIVLSVQSDPMIVSIVFAAIDSHLSGRRRWAFAFLVLASLGRPESWPFCGLYAIWAWRTIPEMRRFVAFGIALIPVLWFGVPTITNARPFVSAELAELSVRRIEGNKFIGVFHRYTALTYLPIQLLAVFAVIVAFLRRNRTVLLLAGAAVLWMVIEMAFVLHGWPGVPRYMFESAGVQCVLAGVAVGWIVAALMQSKVRWRSLVAPRWLGIPVAVAIAATLVPGAIARMRAEHKDLIHEHARTHVINWLATAIRHLGGEKFINYCGKPVTHVGYVSVLAWFTHDNVGYLGHRVKFEMGLDHPIVLFTQLPNGWETLAHHTLPSKVASCTRLNKAWIYTSHHPNGVLVPRH